jgi:hypothetical protein
MRGQALAVEALARQRWRAGGGCRPARDCIEAHFHQPPRLTITVFSCV